MFVIPIGRTREYALTTCTSGHAGETGQVRDYPETGCLKSRGSNTRAEPVNDFPLPVGEN